MKLGASVFLLGLWVSFGIPSFASAQCSLPQCLQVLDTNLDGDITAEFQQAVNDLIYPGGVLTTQTKVRLEAPPPDSYIISKAVRICYDETPPLVGAEDPGDCTGVDTGDLFPDIRLLGGWDQVTLRCIIAEPPTVQRTAYGCLHLGDALNDATLNDMGPLVDVEINLHMTMEETGHPPFNPSTSMILCDGCTGHVDGHYTIGGPATGVLYEFGRSFNSHSLHLAGPNLTVSGTFDKDPNANADYLATITFDGDVRGSGIVGFLDIGATVMVGSDNAARNGNRDGCKWGAYDQPCIGWRLYPGATLFSRSGFVGALWFTEWHDVHLDGTIDHATRTDALQSAVGGHPYDVKAAINFNEMGFPMSNRGQGSVFFDGTCIHRGTINPCIRMLNDEAVKDPNYVTQLFINGLFDRTELLDLPPEIGNGNITGGFTVAAGGEAIIGPNYEYRGANYGYDVGINTGQLRGETEIPVSVTVDQAINPAALPRCISHLNDALVPCAKTESKLTVPNDSYLAVTTMTVNKDVGANTSCDLRWRISGNCTDCEITEIGEPVIVVLDDLDNAASDSSWAFSGLIVSDDPNEFDEGAGSLQLVTQAATSGWAEWTPATPINLLHQYLQWEVWTDPNDRIDPVVFSHDQFTADDGHRLQLFDANGNSGVWHLGEAAGSGNPRLGLGQWTDLLLQHWFEPPTTTDGELDVTQITKIRFVFNTVNSEAGRVYRLDHLRTFLREGNPFRYGFETNFGNFRDYRTRQNGDVAQRMLAGRVPAGKVLQLEVANPNWESCAAGSNCACDDIAATIETALIEVNDSGHHFDRIADGFELFPAPCGGGFLTAFLVLPAIYLRRRWRRH